MPAPGILLHWEVQYLEKVLEGRTRPLVLRCMQSGAAPGSQYRSLVVKAMGLPEVTPQGLVRELLGNLLARELGVLTAAPALVEIDPDTATALNLSLEAKGLQVQPGLAVGTNYLRPLHPLGEALPEGAATEVPRLYGFDLAVQNPDRRPSNPNCALFEDQLLAFDFELAFSFLMALGSAEPWEVSKHGIFAQHIFYPRLRKKRPAWEPLLASLRALTRERIDELIGQLPATWQHEMQKVRIHLVGLLGSLDAFADELQESVA